jgi:diacylglycerol kinase (ATP)
MKSIVLIANKQSGRGLALQAIQVAQRCLWGRPLRVLLPDSAEGVRLAAAELTPEETAAVIVVGGDGTVNQVLGALSRSGIPLLPFPGGTANDLAAELGIRNDWEQVQRLLDHGQTEAIDLITVNHMPFATIAGVGIGATLAAEYNRWRRISPAFRVVSRRLQSQVYALLSAKALFFNRSCGKRLHFQSDIYDEKVKTGAVFICNQARLGGNFVVGPQSRNDDRRFSVLIMPGYRTAQLASALVALKFRRTPPSNFILFSTSQLIVRDLENRSIQAFGDGETLVESPILSFEIQPKALRVYRGQPEEAEAGAATLQGLVSSQISTARTEGAE